MASTTLDCFNAACYADVFQGPFTTFKLTQDKDCDWTGMKFSPDGKLILISTNGQILRLIDAFQGTPLQTFMVKLGTLQCALTAQVGGGEEQGGVMNIILFVFIEMGIEFLALVGLATCFMNMTVLCQPL